MKEAAMRHHHKSSKHKKKKKQKKRKHDSSSVSGSDSQDSEIEWVEAPVKNNLTKNEKEEAYQKEQKSNSPSNDSNSNDLPQASISSACQKKEKRDDWMNEETFVPTLSKTELFYGSSQHKKKEAVREQREKELAIQLARELNPYIKDSGKEVPEEETCAENLQLPSTSVGDGGYSWLKKAYLRIQEQAQEQGRSMEEVAVERWGSLDKLVSMIEEAESRMKTHSKSRYGSRMQREKEEFEFRRSSKPDKFKRPTDDDISLERSPDRSFKFRKPSEDQRHRNQLNFSSSKSHRDCDKSSRYDYERKKDYSEKMHDSERDYQSGSGKLSHSNQNDSLKFEGNRESKIVDSSTCRRNDVSKYESKKTESPQYKERRTDYPKYGDRRKENPNHIPAWKKPKFVEKSRKSLGSSASELDDTKSQDKGIANELPTVSSNEPSSEERSKERTSRKESSPLFYTQDDLSKLASKVFKAELVGDSALASKLKKELDEARKFVIDKGPGHSAKQKEEVILMKRDSSGQAQPLKITDQEGVSSHSNQKGRKNKYFDDGSKYSLKQMFEREKLTTADDNLEMFMEVAAECKDTTDIDYDMDDVTKKVSQKMSHNRQEEKDIGKAIKQHQKRQAALEKCIYCLDQPNMKHHLIVDMGEQVYLCLPNYQSLAEGHCLIVPKPHISSFLCLDEDEWREIEDYKRKLRTMFKVENKSVIFLETSMNFRNCPHAVLECIPMPQEDADMAPMYFKKAILESEAEWANNVKLVDLSKKGLRHSVPKSLPYFAVEFDPEIHAGFAHVIEEEKYFPRNFGKEVVGGMLDIDYNYLHKNKREDPLKKSNEVLQFAKKWKTLQSCSS